MKQIKVGVWLDFRVANLIFLQGKKTTVKNIESGIDTSKPRGGSRAKNAWGPVETVSEKQFLERRKQAEKAFYEKIIQSVQEADELYIFGPAEAKEGLLKMIKSSYQFKPALKGFETADSMTENQKIAKARDFFEEVNA